jgi:hypothetical protein
LASFINVLVLDDLGPDRLNASQRRDLMEIIEDRHGRASTLIASREPTSPMLSSTASSTTPYRLELEGPRSMREVEPEGEAPAPAAPSAPNGKSAKGARK